MSWFIDNDTIFLGPTRMAKTVRTANGLKRDVQSKAFNAIYEDDELYARHLMSTNNRAMVNSLNPDEVIIESTHEFRIFDELPEGWTTCLREFGYMGLRGRWDTDSKYVWCENMPPYRNAYPGDTTRNAGYRQCLVRRK